MKRLIYIIVVLLISSCANSPSMDKKSTSEEILFEASDSKMDDSSILKEKLTTYFDLLKLKEKHPGFATDLNSQLQNLSQNKIIEVKNLETSSIENISISNNVLKVFDSIERIKIAYNIVHKDSTTRDSIFAYKTSTEIIIDGYPVKSFDIKFAKE
jgi:hypothetical protein